MSNKFTPGPWKINTAGSAKKDQPFAITEIYVYAPDTQDDTAICADIIDPVTQEPSEANARLISAAPDLLAAMKASIALADKNRDVALSLGMNVVRPPEMQEIYDACVASVAKATGEGA